MNPLYKFKWRRNFFWRSRLVSGHKYIEDQDKMVLYLTDGGIEELKKWVDCECKLGADWVNMTKEQIKEETGQG